MVARMRSRDELADIGQHFGFGEPRVPLAADPDPTPRSSLPLPALIAADLVVRNTDLGKHLTLGLECGVTTVLIQVPNLLRHRRHAGRRSWSDDHPAHEHVRGVARAESAPEPERSVQSPP